MKRTNFIFWDGFLLTNTKTYAHILIYAYPHTHIHEHIHTHIVRDIKREKEFERGRKLKQRECVSACVTGREREIENRYVVEKTLKMVFPQ